MAEFTSIRVFPLKVIKLSKAFNRKLSGTTKRANRKAGRVAEKIMART